jgi:ABC-type branched-subunit amino acid transport system substrate-binding protein
MAETTRRRPARAVRRMHAGALGAGAALSVLVACSGSSHHPAPSPPVTSPVASATSASAPVTAPASTAPSGGADIPVEGLATLKSYPDTDVGFEARVNRFNKAGGLQGRQIKFLGVKDDGLDPAQNIAALESIAKDGVLAVAPVASDALLAPSEAFLTQHQVAAIGLGSSTVFCASARSATAPGLSPTGCLMTAGYASAADLAHIVQAAGVPAAQVRLALVGQDLDVDKNIVAAIAGLAKAQGVQVVFQSNAIASSGATDYAPIVRPLLAANPNVVVEIADFGGAVALATVLQATGYRGAIVNHVTYAPASVLGQADLATSLNGVYVDAPFPVDENGSDPAVAAIRKDLAAIDKPPTVDLGIAIGYWSADMLIQLLQAAATRGGALTSASLTDTAAAGWTYKGAPGGPSDLTFPAPGWVAPDGCSTLLQLTGTTYKEVAPYGCGPVTKIG